MLSQRTAHACKSRRRWPAWAALAIAAACGPQATAFGLHSPYAILDAASAALGVLLAVAVLTTADRTGCDAGRTPVDGIPLNKKLY